MGGAGDSDGNALAATIDGPFETEVIHLNRSWRTVDEVEFATLAWVDRLNHRRLPEPRGNALPAEFEELYCEDQKSPEHLKFEVPANVPISGDSAVRASPSQKRWLLD